MLSLSGSAANASPEPTSRSGPRTLGKYELLRLIARGGMGEVHLARLPGELGFEKLLVVKTIRADLAADPRFVELFAAEAKTAVGLSHPNIAPIYELGRAEDGTLYTAMGWVDGPSLQVLGERLAARGRPLELGAALFIAHELLDGLAHAHSRDRTRPPVVHRDITPRNVLVDRSGRVQIVDFGIARPAEAEARGVMGSAGYMAPEQARGETVDPRADVFGAACVLYELLTNERAFTSEGVWMSPSLAAIPARVQPLLERALALEPDERFADADEFRRALAPVLAEVAPTFGSRDLAAIVRELFPDEDWHSSEAGGAELGDEHTPATKVPGPVQTFATRLRPTTEPDFLTGPIAALPPEPDQPHTEPRSSAPGRARRSPWLLLALVVALTALAAVTGYLVAREPGELVPTRPPPSPPAPNDDERVSPTPAPPTSPPSAAPEQPATRRLELAVEPAEATVELDGHPIEGPPHDIELGASKQTLRVHHEGHRETIIELDPAALEHDTPLAITLAPLEPGRLSVLAPGVSWAEVWLDGTKLGTTPLTDKPVLEGRHKLEVRCTAAVCGQPRTLLERSIKIKPGRPNEFTAD